MRNGKGVGVQQHAAKGAAAVLLRGVPPNPTLEHVEDVLRNFPSLVDVRAGQFQGEGLFHVLGFVQRAEQNLGVDVLCPELEGELLLVPGAQAVRYPVLERLARCVAELRIGVADDRPAASADAVLARRLLAGAAQNLQDARARLAAADGADDAADEGVAVKQGAEGRREVDVAGQVPVPLSMVCAGSAFASTVGNSFCIARIPLMTRLNTAVGLFSSVRSRSSPTCLPSISSARGLSQNLTLRTSPILTRSSPRPSKISSTSIPLMAR